MTSIREAATLGWVDGFTDKEMLPCHRQSCYRALPPRSFAKLAYRFSFQRTRRRLEKRIREGNAQRPGSVYDPSLDDGRGGLIYQFGKWSS